MEYNEHSNVNSNHLTNGQVGYIVMNYLQKHYNEGEHFSLNKLRRSLTGIPPRKIGGHISRLSREKFIKQNPTAHDDYILLKNIKEYKKKNFSKIPNEEIDTHIEKIDLGSQPVKQIGDLSAAGAVTETINLPTETMPFETAKTALEGNNAPEAISHASLLSEPPAVASDAAFQPTQSVVVSSASTPLTLSEKLLEVAAQLSDMKPDLAKATSQELIDELQRRLLSAQ